MCPFPPPCLFLVISHFLVISGCSCDTKMTSKTAQKTKCFKEDMLVCSYHCECGPGYIPSDSDKSGCVQMVCLFVRFKYVKTERTFPHTSYANPHDDARQERMHIVCTKQYIDKSTESGRFVHLHHFHFAIPGRALRSN